jgi:hypothetical protein
MPRMSPPPHPLDVPQACPVKWARPAAVLLMAATFGAAALPCALAAQAAGTDFAVGGGFGMLAAGMPEAPVLRGSITLGRGSSVVTLRSHSATELVGAGSPDEWLFETGLLLGRRARRQKVDLAAAAGIAWTSGILRGAPRPVSHPSGNPALDLLQWLAEGSPHEEQRFRTVGAPLEVQVAVAPLPRWQLALTGFANVNSGRSFAGAAVESRIGSRRR